MLLGAGHGLVRRDARPGDLIEPVHQPGSPVGRLETWTTFYSAITADAALVWVDPARVSAEIEGLGRPDVQPNTSPAIGDTVTLKPLNPGGAPRQGVISHVEVDVVLPVTGPDWSIGNITYCRQMVCEPMFDQAGDSGAIVLDAHNRPVGMVIGGLPLVERYGGGWTSQTVITPIAAILSHPNFPDELEVVASVPPASRAPTL
ncbi:hypothetical protein [Phenylobacterium sp.]|jgi:hypothetical protein|uniref:hypothetical protein n=1 Tax=Phenylobacterium sp. TaxID=1871053 RepID=UPI002F930EDD